MGKGGTELATKQAQWILDLKDEAENAAHWLQSMCESWTKHRPLHRQLRSHGRRAVEVVQEQPVHPEDVAGIIAVASAPSVARAEEWDAVEDVMGTAARLLGQVPLILDSLCPSCIARISEQGILTVGGDPEMSRAMEAQRQLIARMSKQGSAQRRRYLHMVLVSGESGTVTTTTVSESGELNCAQSGLSTRAVLKETG